MIEENPLVLFTKQYLKRCEERQQKTEKVTDHKEKKENQLIKSNFIRNDQYPYAAPN